MTLTHREHAERLAAGGRAAIADLVAEHDALAGPTIIEMRRHGESWAAIAGYLDLSGVPTPSQHRSLQTMSCWSARAVQRIHDRVAPDPRQVDLPLPKPEPKPQSLGDRARDLMLALDDAGADDLARTLEKIAGEIEYRDI